MAGGEGGRLDVLTEQRAKPVLPFGGSLRLIDFSMSNCHHSQLPDVWVIEQYELHELNEHLANGRPWDLDRTYGGLQIIPPFEIHDGGKGKDKKDGKKDDQDGDKDKDKDNDKSKDNDKGKDKDKDKKGGSNLINFLIIKIQPELFFFNRR